MKNQTPQTNCPHCKGTGKVPDLANAAAAFIARRRKQKLSVREAAVFMEISPGYLSDLENGRRQWSLDLLDKFAEAIRQKKNQKKD